MVCALNFLHGERKVVAFALALLRQPTDAKRRVLDNLRLFIDLWCRPAVPGELDLRGGRKGNLLCTLSATKGIGTPTGVEQEALAEGIGTPSAESGEHIDRIGTFVSTSEDWLFHGFERKSFS